VDPRGETEQQKWIRKTVDVLGPGPTLIVFVVPVYGEEADDQAWELSEKTKQEC
jgi:hypothetical protein